MTIEEAIQKSKSMAEAAKLLNMPFSTFRRKAIKLNLYKPNQSGKNISKRFVRNRFGTRRKTEDILEGKHPQYPTNRVKQRIINEKYLKNICSECGLSETWNGKPIILHLDHINGVSNDHRLENLRLLCPNCHSQTDTWCGKNK